MTDAMTELFTAALGLQEPWRVANVRVEPEAGTIHFDVECTATRLPCPCCGTPDQPIHDRLSRDWQHLHFFQYRALVRARVPRVRCSVCGARGDSEVQQVPVPWARARSGFTLLFEAMAVTLAEMSRMPVRRVAKLLGVSDGRLWRSLGALVDAVGGDEKHVGGGRLITVVHDGSPATRGRVLHVSEGRKAENVGLFVDALATHGGDPEVITRCTMDLSQTYQAGARTHLPHVEICFDPFHLIQMANEAVDAMRRAEVADEPALKYTHCHWLKDARDWTRKEVDLHWLRQSNLKTVRAWHLKECLRKLLAWRSDPHVPVLLLLERWIRWARRCRIGAFKHLAATFQRHREGIHNMLAAANSNVTAESINADIQSAIARARGFRTFRNLRTVIYLLKAKLDLPASPYARVA